MSWPAKIAALDRRALIRSLLVAATAFVLLAMFVDRLTRLAQAEPLAEGRWQVPMGRELVLKGLERGPVLGIEAGAGDGLTLQARGARLDDGGRADRLIWMAARADDAAAGDNRVAIQLSALADAGGGSVVLRRSGEAVTPQLQVRSEGVSLRVEAAVAIGPSLTMPSMTLLVDGRELDPAGMGTSFTLPPGGTLTIEFPAFPDGTSAGTALLPGTSGEEGTRLALREVAVAGRSGLPALKSACAAAVGSYALAAFVRADLAPAPKDADCAAGRLAATALAISPDGLAIDLAGSAYVLEAGRPSASLWSRAMANPVLAQGVNDALPVVLSAIFGLVSFRKRSRRGAKRSRGPPARRRRDKAPAALEQGALS